MEKIVNRLINDAIEGVDTYFHNGSIWLIFTDRKQWVIELTENRTLWYNYDFFKNLFNYTSLGVVENQHYITMWVEDTLQNGVKYTLQSQLNKLKKVEDTLQNGVKDTVLSAPMNLKIVEDILQNGVKDTEVYKYTLSGFVEDTIQNGVKYTLPEKFGNNYVVEDTLQNGVKSISQISREPVRQVEDIIQNGDLI